MELAWMTWMRWKRREKFKTAYFEMSSITYCFKSGCISASVTYYINGWCFRFLKLSSRCSITPGPSHLPEQRVTSLEQRVTSLEQPHSVCVCRADTFTAACQLELISRAVLWKLSYTKIWLAGAARLQQAKLSNLISTTSFNRYFNKS